MAKQTINVGTTANDKKGDSLRSAFQKVNANFTELYTQLGLNDNNLNLGAFEFTGSTMSTTDSTSITIDQATTVTSDLTVGGDILPSTDNGANIGSPTKQWKSLYVSNDTIYLNNIPLGLDGENNLTVNGKPLASFNDNGNLTVSNFIEFWDSSIQETAYRYTASATAPTMTTGALWFNTDEGKLYVNYNNLWVDANPTEIDPSAIRFNNQNQIELPEGGDIVDINGDSVLGADTGNIEFRNDTINDINGILITNASQTVEATATITIPTNGSGGVSIANNNNTWIFGDDGSLTLPPGFITSNQVTGLNLRSGYDVHIISNHMDVDHEWILDSYGDLTLPGDIKSEGAINIDINLTDSTLRRWTFGEDGDTTLPNSTTIGDDLAGEYSDTFLCVPWGYVGEAGLFSSNNVTRPYSNPLIATVTVGWYVSGPLLNGVKEITEIVEQGDGDRAFIVDLTDGSAWANIDITIPYRFYTPDYALVYNGTRLTVGSNKWNFTQSGNLTIPGNINERVGNGLEIAVHNNRNNDGTPGAALLSLTNYDAVDGQTLTKLDVGAYNIELSTDFEGNFTGTKRTWTFDRNGHLTVPGSIKAIGTIDGDGVGNGKNLTVQAGETITGDGGDLTVHAGDTITGVGGDLTVRSGAATTGNAGVLNVRASDTVSGDGGMLNVRAGDAVTGDAGNIDIRAGDTVTGDGGSITITAGSTINNGPGGSVTITSGGNVNNDAGDINLVAATSSSGADGVINLTTAVGTWTFGDTGNLTFPDTTVQTTAYLGITNEAGGTAVLAVGGSNMTTDALSVRIVAGMGSTLDVEINYSLAEASATVMGSSTTVAFTQVLTKPLNIFGGQQTLTANNTTWTTINAETLSTIGDSVTAIISEKSFHKIYRVTVIARTLPDVGVPGDAYCTIETLK